MRDKMEPRVKRLKKDEDVDWKDGDYTFPASFSRPPFDLGAYADKVVFQQVEVDYSMMTPLPGTSFRSSSAPYIRLYGVTRLGHSICVKVHGFVPYFYVEAPSGFSPLSLQRFEEALNEEVVKVLTGPNQSHPPVLGVEIVRRKSILGYRKEAQTFLKIMMSSPRYIPKCREIVERGIGGQSMPTYEANLPFILRYMIDTSLVGMGWLEISLQHCTMPTYRISNCNMEVDILYQHVKVLPIEGELMGNAPIRILSYDIECAGRKGVFPTPDVDPVIQIAAICTVQGQQTPFARVIFTLNSCLPIPGTHVYCYKEESALLLGFHAFLHAIDPDVITGYNIINFDTPYLIGRAHTLQIPSFTKLGRLVEGVSKVMNTTTSSKQMGKRETKETNISGRIQFDVLVAVQRDYKLRSYSLNAVSAHFLKEQKEDVHHSIITSLQHGTIADRHRLAVYCVKDAVLPQRLCDKLMLVINAVEMARVTGVPMNFLLNRGQQIKVLSQLYRYALQEGLLIPVHHIRVSGNEEGYEGATVYEPKVGYYTDPITTLDFASLYPSIMMAHNLCYSTLVPAHLVSTLPAEDYERTPCGDAFVKGNVKEGLLPRILRDLLSARKAAKRDMNNATDPFEKSVFNARQLALKISANSVYGFTGAQVGRLPCLEISAGVTAYGREMIKQTRELVEARYNREGGYPYDAQVIYGDTDSVMVKFGGNDIREAMKMGLEAATYVSEHFPAPVRLEFEKVYCPYLLISKKRYAGLYWTRPEGYDYMDMKGIESVRRDNAPLVKMLIDRSLQHILIDRDIDKAVRYVQTVIQELLLNRLDISLLVISKSLSKSIADYQARMPHVELAERMRKRDAGSAPVVGDRIPFVYIKGPKGSRAYERAEDPLYVLDNNLPIDTQYYLENQLSKPLLRIFRPVMSRPESLLSGEHTKRIIVPTAKRGALSKFITRKQLCLGCNQALEPGFDTVCNLCQPYEGEIYRRHLSKVNRLESEFTIAWTQCQRCQESFHQTVLCENRDCPIFYVRKKIQKDLDQAQETLAKFTLQW